MRLPFRCFVVPVSVPSPVFVCVFETIRGTMKSHAAQASWDKRQDQRKDSSGNIQTYFRRHALPLRAARVQSARRRRRQARGASAGHSAAAHRRAMLVSVAQRPLASESAIRLASSSAHPTAAHALTTAPNTHRPSPKPLILFLLSHPSPAARHGSVSTNHQP